MRRFVVLNKQNEILEEGVEYEPGGYCSLLGLMTRPDGSKFLNVLTYDSVKELVDEMVDEMPAGRHVSFIDWHTVREAYELTDVGQAGKETP